MINLIIILAYFGGILLIGYLTKRKIREKDDYVLASRSVGLVFLTATLFASGVGGGTTIGMTAEAYLVGAGILAASFGYGFAILTVVIIIGKLKKSNLTEGVTSVPELITKRFFNKENSRALHVTTAVITWIYTFLLLGLQIMAAGTVISFFGDGLGVHISLQLGIIIATVIAIIYTTMGGLHAVIWADTVGTVLMILGMMLIGPIFASLKAGGIKFVFQTASAAGISAVNPFSGTTIPYLIGVFMAMWLVNVVEPFIWQRVFAAKNSTTAQWSVFLNWVLSTFYDCALIILALSSRILIPNVAEKYGTVDKVLPVLIGTIFPVGLAGLMIASVLAAIMSSADSYMLIAGNTLIDEIIAPLAPGFLKNRDNVKTLRVSTVAVGGIALIVALLMEGIFDSLIFMFSLYGAALFVPLVATIYWPRTTTYGIFASMVSGAIVVLYGYITGWTVLDYDPVVPASFISLILVIVVSLVTQDKDSACAGYSV